MRRASLAIVAGTYSINETVSAEPRVDPRWFCRNAIAPGRWNAMAISPASAANYDWFLDTLCRADQAAAEADGRSVHALLAAEIDAALGRPSTALFHPYLFGSPHGPAASAGFLGLRGWHDRGDAAARGARRHRDQPPRPCRRAARRLRRRARRG